MKQLRQILLMSSLLLLGVSCTDTGTDIPLAPEFTEVISQAVMYNSITLKASFSETTVSKGGFTITDSGTDIETTVEASIDGNSISATVTGLKEETTYSFVAFIVNGAGNTARSEKGSFTTGKAPDPKDIVSISDETLKKWILARYDSNKDGEISYEEAEYVSLIELKSDHVYSLSGIECFPNLGKIHAEGSIINDIGYGHIEAADLSQNPKIYQIYLVANKIKTTSFAKENNHVLVEYNYNELTEFDASSLLKSERIAVSWNNIHSLDFSGLHHLDELHCDNNPLESLVLDNKKLVTLTCNNTNIKTLDLRKCPIINNIDCSDCPYLETILLTKNQVPGNFRKDQSAHIVYE